MELEKIAIAILMVTVISTSFFVWSSQFSIYGVEVDDTFKSTYDKLNETTTIINESQSRLFSGGASEEFGFVPTIQGVMDIAALLKTSMGTIGQMLQDLSTYAKVPPAIIVAILGILTIGFIFALIKVTMRVTKT